MPAPGSDVRTLRDLPGGKFFFDLGVYIMDLSRREFIGGAAATAICAGLGFASSPRKVYAVAGVDDAVIGSAIIVILGLLGVQLVHIGVAIAESDLPAAVGASFRGFCTDTSNVQSAIQTGMADSAASYRQTITEYQMQQNVHADDWFDNLCSGLVDAQGVVLDFVNAGTAQACLLWSLIKNWLGMASADWSTVSVNGMSYGNVDARTWLSSVSAPAAMISAFDSLTGQGAEIRDNCKMFFGCVRKVDYRTTYYDAYLFDNVLPHVSGDFTGLNNCVDYNRHYSSGESEAVTGRFFARDGVAGSTRCLSVNWNASGGSSWKTSNSGSFAVGQSRWDYKSLAGYGIDAGVNYPQQGALDNAPDVLNGRVGYGDQAILGSDMVVDGNNVTSAGHVGLGADVLGGGNVAADYNDLVWDGRAGVVTDISGVVADSAGAISIPIDTPVTVGVVDGVVTGTATRSIADARATDTSLSRVGTGEGTLQPGMPDGTNPNVPNDNPFSKIPFASVFPFNIPFSIVDWIANNF